MSETLPPGSEREQRLQQVLAEYLHAVAAGKPLDRDQLLKQHPDLVDELASFFRNRDAVERLAEPLKVQAGSDVPTIGPEYSVDSGVGAKVRYFGDYELVAEIARGGMGVVYRARQVSLNRIVALKMILKGELASEADVQRFRQEAEAAASLDHPNIVPIYEVGEHEGQHYFSMKLIEHTPFSRDPKGSVDQHQVARLLATIARAVHHAHQRGILHRDLKPRNILIDARGDPHVTDFGLAKRTASPGRESGEAMTRSGAIVGTPSYMAPEQARADKTLTTAVDVYSLGAILYEWLTGRPPFRGGDPLSILMQVVEQEPTRPRSLNPRIERDLETICLKCLEKEPAKRYGSADALADDLERWLRGEPISARRTSAWERTAKWARRKPLVAALLGGVMLVTVLGIAGVAWQWRQTMEALRAMERALLSADGMRLTAQSELVRPSNPGLALLLAIEGAERQPGLLANNALLAALAECTEQRMPFGQWLPEDVTGAIYSPDGKQALTWSRHRAHVWEVATGRPLASEEFEWPQSILLARFSPDGSRILTVSEREDEETQPLVRCWSTSRGIARWKLPPQKRPHAVFPGEPCTVSFRPDGKWVIVTTNLESNREPAVFEVDTGKEVFALKGHKEAVVAASFSPDGKLIVTASADKTAGIWDAATGKRLYTLAEHTSGVVAVAYSSDGKRVLTLEGYTTVRIWDATTGKHLFRLPDADGAPSIEIRSASFSPDNNWVLTGGNKEVCLWDAVTGKRIRSYHTAPDLDSPPFAVFSPDGRRVAAFGLDRQRWTPISSRKFVYLWDTATGKELHRLRGHTAEVVSVAFSPDGRHLLSAAGHQSARVWDVSDPAPENGHWPGASLLGMSRDRKRLLTGTHWNSTLHWWDACTQESLEGFAGRQGPTTYRFLAGFSGNGDRIAIGFEQPAWWEMRVFQTGTQQPMAVIGEQRHLAAARRIGSVALNSNGQLLLVADSARGHVVNVATGKEVLVLEGGKDAVNWAQFSPDDRWVLTTTVAESGSAWGSDTTACLFDAATGRLVMELKRPPGKRFSGYWCYSAAFSADSRRVLTAYGLDAQIWDVANGKELIAFEGHKLQVRHASFSADEKRVLTASQDRTARIWDAGTGRVLTVLEGHDQEVLYAEFSPDETRILTTSSDETARLWDAATGKELATWKLPQKTDRAFFSADGRWGFTASRFGVQRWPIDPLAFARVRRPRELTPAERDQFAVFPFRE